MRFKPFLSTTLYTLSSFRRLQTPTAAHIAESRALRLRSMSGIPFFSALFGSSSNSAKMSYPDQRSDDEWRAVLNKGII
jgi:peptide-methionine (R)-S-oxide reductase